MTLEILFITCNRLAYTRQALASLLADTDDFSLSIWDNVSTDGTREFLESVTDPRIKQKVFATRNAYLTGAANEVFGKSQADLLAIIPDDFLLPPGWIRPLLAVHEDLPKAGLISACRSRPSSPAATIRGSSSRRQRTASASPCSKAARPAPRRG